MYRTLFKVEEQMRINLSCVREPEDTKAIDGELVLVQGDSQTAFTSFDLAELAPFFRSLARACEAAENSSSRHSITIEVIVPTDEDQ